MERTDTRLKNKFTNGKPSKVCNAPNWNPTHKCLALGNFAITAGRRDISHAYADKEQATNAK